jgi:hypothetical protein
MPRPSIQSSGSSRGSNSSGNFFTRFLRNEIFAPDKRWGNIDIIISVTVFVATVTFLQNYGELLAV